MNHQSSISTDYWHESFVFMKQLNHSDDFAIAPFIHQRKSHPKDFLISEIINWLSTYKMPLIKLRIIIGNEHSEELPLLFHFQLLSVPFHIYQAIHDSYKKHNDTRQNATYIEIFIHPVYPSYTQGIIHTADLISERRDKFFFQITFPSSVITDTSKRATSFSLYKNSIEQFSFIPVWIDKCLASQLIHFAESIEKKWGPVRIEWAADQKNNLTVLFVEKLSLSKAHHLNALDTEISDNNTLFSYGSQNETFHGAYTPLSISVFYPLVDTCFIKYATASGIPKHLAIAGRYYKSFYNRIFINVTAIHDLSIYIARTTTDNLVFFIFGQIIGLHKPPYQVSDFVRWKNFLRNIRLLLTPYLTQKKIELGIRQIPPIDKSDEHSIYNWIDNTLKAFPNIYYPYLLLSYGCVAYYSALSLSISKSTVPDEKEVQKLNYLFALISNNKSTTYLRLLYSLVNEIKRDSNFKNGFSSANSEDALLMITRFAPKNIAALYKKLLQQFGHTTDDIYELMTPSLKDNPDKLVQLLQETLQKEKHADEKNKNIEHSRNMAYEGMGIFKKNITQILVLQLQRSIIRRDNSLSQISDLTYRIKRAFHLLSQKLIEKGIINHIDDIYYLKHEEIGLMLQSANVDNWNAIIINRKASFELSKSFHFKQFYSGKPYPIDSGDSITTDDGQFIIKGTPMSPGLSKGKVRIVYTLADARKIMPNEVLVTPFTDLSYAPYFRYCAGIISEVGNPLSNEAMIFRELQMPAITGIPNITQLLRTGDEVIVDGDIGVIEMISCSTSSKTPEQQ